MPQESNFPKLPKLPSMTAVETKLAIAAWLEDLIKDCKKFPVAANQSPERRAVIHEKLLQTVRGNQSQIIKVVYPFFRNLTKL